MDYLFLVQFPAQKIGISDKNTEPYKEAVLACAPIVSALSATDHDVDEQIDFMNQADFCIQVFAGKRNTQNDIPVAKTTKGFRSLVTALKNNDTFGAHANDPNIFLKIDGSEYGPRQDSETLELVNQAYQEIIRGHGE